MPSTVSSDAARLRDRLARRSTDGTSPSVSPALGPCRVWLGKINRDGYAIIKVCGREVSAHRTAYELDCGPIPDGLQIDHLCRVRSCIRVSHLEAVTGRENTLRGDTLPARWAARSACDSGHEFTPENTIQRADGGGRRCRTCSRESDARRWARRRAAAVASALGLLLAVLSPATSPPTAAPVRLHTATIAVETLTVDEAAYIAGVLEAQRRTAEFLTAAAATSAAVPVTLRHIMWCEAGRYVNLPRYTTNYAAMTHGYDGASGGAQMLGSTWLTWAREIGVDVARWPRAFLAPAFVQDAVATHGYRTRGVSPWNPSRSCWG